MATDNEPPPTLLGTPEPQTPDRPEGGVADAGVASAAIANQAEGARRRKASDPDVRYVGFRATSEGREYTLRVAGLLNQREFVVLIAHEVFASRRVSFQDGPGLCFAKVKRELAADAELLPGAPIVLSAEELAAHRLALEKASAPRRRPRPAPAP